MITIQRLEAIISKARYAKKRADLLVQQWAARIAYLGSDLAFSDQPQWVQDALPKTWQGYKSNAMTREWLPEVSLEEHDEIVTEYPDLAKWTRLYGTGKDEWMDFSPMGSAQRPTIREIWVGARSLGCIAGETAETESEGLSASQLDQEDAAELTELQTLLYHDASTGVPMTTDEDTGEWRPVRKGDLITIVRGSNDDLDALFLEEGDDPRPQGDHEAYGSEHKYSDRYQANTSLEENFLHGSPATDRIGPKLSQFMEPSQFGRNIHKPLRDYKLPNNALPEGLRWNPDESEITRLAEEMANKLIARTPSLAPDILDLIEEARTKFHAMVKDVRFDHEGAMISGYFIERNEFFGTLEANRNAYDEVVRRYETKPLGTTGKTQPAHRDYAGVVTKAAPKAMDWTAIRKAQKHVLNANHC